MQLFGNIVVYIIMACAVIGAIASIVKEDSELGKQFLEGINAIGAIFIPVGGIMAAAPYITKFVVAVFGKTFAAVGADPAIAATTFIAVDMGGYQLADTIAQTRESWIMAMVVGYMAGATIVFSIPIALKMLPATDRRYMALGTMCGFLSIPIGVFVSCAIIAISNPLIRETVSTNTPMQYQLALGFGQIFMNLIPLIIICLLIALGLICMPNKMIKGFIAFGKIMDSGLKIVFVLCVVEYFTGACSTLLGSWGFDPMLADELDVVRALELAGAIGMILCGAFPMVYLIQKFLSKPINMVGKRVGLSTDATTGILAASANALALFAMVKDMKPEDKVKTLAYSICGAFLFGDHLAFTVNFQPSLILPVFIGKLSAGIVAVIIAKRVYCWYEKKEESAGKVQYEY